MKPSNFILFLVNVCLFGEEHGIKLEQPAGPPGLAGEAKNEKSKKGKRKWRKSKIKRKISP